MNDALSDQCDTHHGRPNGLLDTAMVQPCFVDRHTGRMMTMLLKVVYIDIMLVHDLKIYSDSWKKSNADKLNGSQES